MRVANALIRADKRFEMQVYPGMRHSYMPISSYVMMARGDFFARWLLGSFETGADIIELQNQRQAKRFSKRFCQKISTKMRSWVLFPGTGWHW